MADTLLGAGEEIMLLAVRLGLKERDIRLGLRAGYRRHEIVKLLRGLLGQPDAKRAFGNAVGRRRIAIAEQRLGARRPSVQFGSKLESIGAKPPVRRRTARRPLLSSKDGAVSWEELNPRWWQFPFLNPDEREFLAHNRALLVERVKFLDALGSPKWWRGSALGGTIYFVADFRPEFDIVVAESWKGSALYFLDGRQAIGWRSVFRALDRRTARDVGAGVLRHTTSWQVRASELIYSSRRR